MKDEMAGGINTGCRNALLPDIRQEISKEVESEKERDAGGRSMRQQGLRYTRGRGAT